MKKFVIIASQRTGSNMLVSTLRSHPDIECHGELFRKKKKYLKGGVSLFAEIDPRFQQEAYLNEHWQELLDLVVLRAEEAGAGAVGFKLMTQHLEAVQTALINDDSWAKIVLMRDNLLAVYSSDKIAKAQRQQGLRKLFSKKKSQVKFVAEEFSRFSARYAQGFDGIKDKLAQTQQAYLETRYSAICEAEGIRSVIEHLGMNPDAEWEVVSRKRNSSQLLERFSNPAEVSRYLAATGREEWLVE